MPGTKTFFLAAGLALSLAAPASADLARAVETQILPGYSALASTTQALAEATAASCDPAAIRPAYGAAFDAWMQVGHLRLGPGELAAITIAFWPDTRSATPRALNRMIADQDPLGTDPAEYVQVSAAARGFFALDTLVFDPDPAGDPAYRCALTATVAADLAAQAKALDAGWREGFAATLTTAGEAGNSTYLAPEEAVQALYTQLLAGLEFTEDQRLARPLDSFDKPHPKRAEAWRSARSLPNIRASLKAQRALAVALADAPIPLTEAAFDAADAAASVVVDPGFQDITDAQAWFRADVLRQRVLEIRQAVEAELGAQLGVAAGFNSADGD
ncbi:imelysin family protein [Paracoccus zhejiangensis]|uniref:Signal peptidase n=1 Tax=Paracoccus zhejiangensis TaxID=1077935 RepID=A0A2H5EXE8_9RHOB|nr:imelysin family protein [Paracoccus zhejiangensis]AUH63981.1 signal peptidase [Paracoccus zhejiangensis]